MDSLGQQFFASTALAFDENGVVIERHIFRQGNNLRHLLATVNNVVKMVLGLVSGKAVDHRFDIAHFPQHIYHSGDLSGFVKDWHGGAHRLDGLPRAFLPEKDLLIYHRAAGFKHLI